MEFNKLNKQDTIRIISVLVALALLLWGCLVVLEPFIPALIWAVILCLTTWPAFDWLQRETNNQSGLSAFLMTLFLAMCFIVPLIFLGSSAADNFSIMKDYALKTLAEKPDEPPVWIATMPVVGDYLSGLWAEYFVDTGNLRLLLQNYAAPISQFLIGVGASIGRGILDLSLGVLIAFFFFRHGRLVVQRLDILIDRFIGERGQSLLDVSKKTMIGVVYGVLGTALAQGTIAGIGFAIAGIPGAPFLGLLTFLLSFIPMGPPFIWIPAVLWLLSEDQIGMAVFMLAWGLMVSSLDNIIRPYFISLGSALPLLLVLLGVFGGILAFGFIGLFIGPVLLALAYTLIIEWSTTEKRIIDLHAGEIRPEPRPE